MNHKLQGFVIVTQGGAGEPLAFTDGCEAAAERGREKMRETGDALDAAIAAGIGGHIIRHMLARNVYGWIEQGVPLQQALQRAIDLIDKDADTGLIAVTRTEAASCSNTHMPTGTIVD